MSIELKGKDLRNISIFLVFFSAWIVVQLYIATVFGSSRTREVVMFLIEIIVAGIALFYAFREGAGKWTGELKRLLNIFIIAAVILLLAQAGLAAVHIINPNLFGIPEMAWHEAATIGNLAGLLIAAYGFYEFGNAEWYPEGNS